MSIARLCLVVLCLWSGVAFAQESRPCERDPKPHPAGGMDADVIRCMLFRQSQRAGQLGAELDRVQAVNDIQSDDLKKVIREKEQLEAQMRRLDGWFVAWFGGGK